MQKVEFWCVEVEFSDRGEAFPVSECETVRDALVAYARKHDFAPGTTLVAQGMTHLARMVIE